MKPAYVLTVTGLHHNGMQRLSRTRDMADIYVAVVGCETAVKIDVAKGEDVNVALMRHGYIGATPVTPAFAFHLDMLKHAHSGRKAMPGAGMQGLFRQHCDFHGVRHMHFPILSRADVNLQIQYTHGLQLGFRQAFDIYLEVLANVDAKIDAALGRGEDFQAKMGCPTCGNEVCPIDASAYLRTNHTSGCRRILSWRETLRSSALSCRRRV